MLSVGLQSSVWAIAEQQHGIVTHAQLRRLGYSQRAIDHRNAIGRLHRVWPGVFAVGRPGLTRHGLWTAAVLACGEGAALSHFDGGALYEIVTVPPLAQSASTAATAGVRPIEISVPYRRCVELPGIVTHRRSWLGPATVTRRFGIAVTEPVSTLIDLATRLGRDKIEAAINEADKRDVIDPEALRAALESVGRRPGVAVLREILDRRTFTLTDSQLERRFPPIARAAGLGPPLTQQWVNGYRVDFYWPQLGLVVETDGLRYHRTPADQARDRVRDQAHTAAGLMPLRFTHAQIRYDPGYVRRTLERTAARLRADR